MTTMNSVIEYVDSVKPNAYSENEKYRWLHTLEGLISREVHDDHAPECNLPEDADAPLMVPSPYDELYSLYVMAMIDFHNREYDDYNNTILVFQERLEQYKAWYIRNRSASRSRNFRNVMG